MLSPRLYVREAISNLRIAYVLWGLAFTYIGIFDALLDEDWTAKAFAWIFTLIIFSLWIIYELLGVRVVDSGFRKLVYTLFMLVGTNNWNVAWAVTAYMFCGWRPGETIWLAPGIVWPIWLYWVMTVGGFLLWLGFWIYISVVDRYYLIVVRRRP